MKNFLDENFLLQTKTAPKTKIKTVKSKSDVVTHHNPFKLNLKDKIGDVYTKKLKNNSKLLEVKDVKKAQMARWMLFMIIALAAALFFIIMAIIFGYAVFVYALYILFWILAGLCFIAAFLFLVLGLTGVMS